MSSGRKAGITAVAERAGVSIATVSRVMSGSASVNKDMAERVRAAAAELGYRANWAAKGLASGMHHSLGVVMPDLTNPYFSYVLQAISVGAADREFRLVVADSRGKSADELDVCENLSASVDGLVLLSPRMPLDDLRSLAKQPVPVVLVNRVELGVDIPMVAVDNFSPTLQLCHHVVGLGHRKAVYLAGSMESWQSRERWRGVQQAKILGLESELVPTDGTLESGYAAVDAALRHEPTVLIAFNDLVAVGAMAALRAKGIRIPEDVSVTGFDDITLATYTEPQLTTAKSPYEDLGRRAWELLWSGLQGERPVDPPLLDVDVIFRTSTGPAPGHAAGS